MRLVRAFYKKINHMQDQVSLSITSSIETCIWKTDEFGNPDKNARTIDAKAAPDNDKEVFLTILRTGEIPHEQKSTYAIHCRFFRIVSKPSSIPVQAVFLISSYRFYILVFFCPVKRNRKIPPYVFFQH